MNFLEFLCILPTSALMLVVVGFILTVVVGWLLSLYIVVINLKL